MASDGIEFTPAKGVHVVNRARLTSYLGGLPQTIQPGQREQSLLAAARLASTWLP